MEEVQKNEEEFKNAEIICGDCTGEFMQLEYKENKQRLFSIKGYMKWLYQCNKCGKQSKIFSSKIKK